RGQDGTGLWNEEDGFFYDVLRLPDGAHFPMQIRSMVGLIPLFAVETLEPELLDRLPGFKRRLEWFIDNRPDLIGNVACMRTPGMRERRLLAIATRISSSTSSSICWTSASSFPPTESERSPRFIAIIHTAYR